MDLSPKSSIVVIRFQVCIFDILNTAKWYDSRRIYSCDSLSSLYLWHIKYSYNNLQDLCYSVVIRFQVCIFDILNTAGLFYGTSLVCCDSLSSLYLWHIKYSFFVRQSKPRFVVIRFQVCIFDILNTASRVYGRYCWGLWFAFKFVSLTY